MAADAESSLREPTLKTVRIAAAQTPEFREDVDCALAWAADVAAEAREAGAVLLCFPEGFLQGYLTDAAAAGRQAIELGSAAFAAVQGRLPADGPTIVMGLIEREGERLFNTAVVVGPGRRPVGRYRKAHLLRREAVFTPGGEAGSLFEAGGLRFGVNICFDTNFPQAARAVAEAGATLLVCPANNMLPRATAEACKETHNAVRGERCRETGLWMVSADVTGERDGHVAWGPTAVIDPQGAVAAQLPLGAPGLLTFDLPVGVGA